MLKIIFFLDNSFPMIYSLSSNGEKKIALRFSEFEGTDTIHLMSKKVNWIWVDCFSKLPITRKNYKLFKKLKYKLCLVSPELQGQIEKLEKYKLFLKKENIKFDMICSNRINISKWLS
jgi:hypothetical protein